MKRDLKILQRRRLRGAYLVTWSIPHTEMARRVGVIRQLVNTRAKKLETGGQAALVATLLDRPSRFDIEQERVLTRFFKRETLVAGFPVQVVPGAVNWHRLWQVGLMLILLQPVCPSAGEAQDFARSVVVFNTVCARCHEGECSGRLGLVSDHEAAVGHISRHYPQADGNPSLQSELFDILAYMKDHCAYYPLQAPLPPDRLWKTGRLDALKTDPDGNYFVPLGTLSPGVYRLVLEFQQDVQGTIQLISDQFDMVVEESLASADGRLEISFPVEIAGEYFFRLYPQHPARITRLVVTPADNGTAPR